MPARSPPSLGDGSHTEFSLARFEVPLPESRKEKVAAFESILNQGGVQKVVFEVGKPILVSRLVNKDDLSSPPPEAPFDDLWKQIRNTTIEEFIMNAHANGDPFRVLFHGFSELNRKRLKVACLYCHDYQQLRRWLSLPELSVPLDYVFGVGTSAQSDVPEDAVVLVGLPHDDNLDGVCGLRLPVDLPRPKRAFDPTVLGVEP